MLTLAIIATILLVINFIFDIGRSVERANNITDFIGSLIGICINKGFLITVIWLLFVF
jgi:hypothetical protein